MRTQLENIKEYLLDKYSEFTTGYANVQKPDGTDLIRDEQGGYAGIDDSKGNYFYIRSLKSATLNPIKRGCKVQYYEQTTACRIVSVMHSVNEEQVAKVLIEAVSRLGHAATKVVTERTQVFFEETGTRNLNDNMRKISLVAVDFEVVELLNAKDCKLTICEC